MTFLGTLGLVAIGTALAIYTAFHAVAVVDTRVDDLRGDVRTLEDEVESLRAELNQTRRSLGLPDDDDDYDDFSDDDDDL